MKKIFITGGSGFIGKYIIKKFKDQGFIVENFDLTNGDDIRSRFEVFKKLELFQADAVVHLAAQASVRRGDKFENEYLSTNVMGAKNIADAAEEFSVDAIIHFSSSSVYGDNDLPKKETDPKNPISWYGLTKSWSEEIMLTSDIPKVYVIRPFTVYGKGGRTDQVIYKWINQIKKGEPISKYGAGDTVRGYTHVEDLLEGVIKCIKKEGNCQEIINLGGNEPVSLNKLVDIYKKCIPDLQVDEMDLPKCDVKSSIASIEKAKDFLGWEPKRNFEREITKILIEELQ